MSSIKIKDLPEKIDNLEDEDLLVIEDREDTKKITLIRLRSAFSMDGILISMKEMLLEKFNTFVLSHNNRYTELVERNRQLEVTCANLENDHIHDAERIFELEDRLVNQTENVKTLQTEKTKLENMLVVLQVEKDNLNAIIETLNTTISDNEELIEDLTSRYGDLESEYNTLKETTEDLKEKVESLESSSDTNISDFINEKNTEITTKINQLMDYLRYYHPDVDDLEV